MEPTPHPGLARVLARARQDADVLAVILYGSRARDEARPDSDFDVCLVLRDDVGPDLDRARKRLDYLAEAAVDLTIFQQLPLYIRPRVLREGEFLFVRDAPALYEVAIRTAKAWERFRPIYRLYLDAVARG